MAKREKERRANEVANQRSIVTEAASCESDEEILACVTLATAFCEGCCILPHSAPGYVFCLLSLYLSLSAVLCTWLSILSSSVRRALGLQPTDVTVLPIGKAACFVACCFVTVYVNLRLCTSVHGFSYIRDHVWNALVKNR